MKRLIGLLIGTVMVLCFMACSPEAGSKTQGYDAIGFEDEEEAIEYFMTKINQGDLDAAMNACAYEIMADNFDYEEFAEHLDRVMSVAHVSSSDYELGKRINALKYEMNVLRQLTLITFQLKSDGDNQEVLDGMNTPLSDADLDSIMECFDNKVLEDLELVDIIFEDQAKSDRYKETMDDQTKIYDADDMTVRTLIYKFEGEYYQGGIRLIEYDDLWYVMDLIETASDHSSMDGTLYKFEDGEYK